MEEINQTIYPLLTYLSSATAYPLTPELESTSKINI